MATLTVSGNEITDAVRLANTQGDGRAYPDSSFGIWETTTNLVPNGGIESGTTNIDGAGTGPVLTRDVTTFKFGTACLKVVAGAVSGAGARWRNTASPNSNIAIVASTLYTVSAWVKGNVGGEALRLEVNTLDSTGGSLNFYDLDFTATIGWVRYTLTFTSGVGEVQARVIVKTRTAVAATFFVDGVQLEQKGYATPYLETNGATATRPAASVQAPSALLSAAQGWIALRVRAGIAAPVPNSGSQFAVQWRISAGNPDGYTLRYRGNSDGLGGWRLDQSVNSVNFFTRLTPVVPFAVGDLITIVAYWTPTLLGISVNGSAFITVPSAGSAPDMTLRTIFDLGSDQLLGIGDAGLSFLWFTCGTGVLANADATTLNTLGNNDPTLATLPKSAATTAAWSADTSNYNRFNKVQIVVPITITTTRGPRLVIKNKVVLPLIDSIGLVKRVFFNPNKFVINIQLQAPTHTKKIVKAAKIVPLNLGVSSHKKRFHTAAIALTLAVGSQSRRRYHGLKRAIRTIPGLDRVNRDI